MGKRTEVEYFLPVTLARLRAEVTTVTDGVTHTRQVRCPGLVVELVTVADPERPRRLVVDSGVWRDYSFSLSLTEDGRLTAAGVESSGQTGKVIAGAAAVGAAAVGLATGSFPLFLGAAAAAGAAGRGAASGVGPATLEPPRARAGAEDPVGAAYTAACPVEAARLGELVAERGSAADQVRARRAAYLAAPAGDDIARYTARASYEVAKSVLADVELELEMARAHFSAWRATTLDSVVVVRDLLVPLDALPTFDGKALDWGPQTDAVRELFELVGSVVTRLPEPRRHPTGRDTADQNSTDQNSADQNSADRNSAYPATGTRAATGAVVPDGRDALHVLRPRWLELAEVERGDDGTLLLRKVLRELVMDSACPEMTVAVRRSWNARRRTDLTLSELGAVVGLAYNGDSAAAGAAQAASGAVRDVTGSVESALKTRSAILDAAGADRERELARLKNLVAVGEQQLLAASQAATAADYARLARLKQQLEIAQTESRSAEPRSAQPRLTEPRSDGSPTSDPGGGGDSDAR